MSAQDHTGWWSHRVQPWWRDIDYLGHVTAASYAAIYEEAFGAFMIEQWADQEPSYVVAKMSISYVREIRLQHTPLDVYVSVDSVTDSDITASMVIVDKEGQVRSTAATEYVTWDREQRRRRSMTPSEMTSLATPRR